MDDDAHAGLGRGEFAKDRELRLQARKLTGIVEHQHPVDSRIFASRRRAPRARPPGRGGAGAGDFYDRALHGARHNKTTFSFTLPLLNCQQTLLVSGAHPNDPNRTAELRAAPLGCDGLGLRDVLLDLLLLLLVLPHAVLLDELDQRVARLRVSTLVSG
eukprot:scaffold62089_cov36-Phaeocystis_antarctica.AAC.1